MSRSKAIAEFAPGLSAIGDREPTPASKTISPIAISERCEENLQFDSSLFAVVPVSGTLSGGCPVFSGFPEFDPYL
jgi:hypothetical protein